MLIKYVTKILVFRYYFKLLGAMLLLILLPVVAAGATVGVLIATGVPTPFLPEQQMVEYLANKNVSYWFIALAVVAITSWTFTGKWLLKQLEAQRLANQDIVNKLITYMEKDHAAMISVVTDVSLTQKRTVEVLEVVLKEIKVKA